MQTREYEKFDIVKVALAFGVKLHPIQNNPVEIKALCPFCGDTKYHLGLNREKEQFHCFRCRESGNSVTLAAKLCGISNREAYTMLKKAAGNPEPRLPLLPKMTVNAQETPIKSVEERHGVYYDLLSLLSLRPTHRENLTERGLSFSHIHQFMYRSIPLDPIFRREVINALSAKHDLCGIPGFYRDGNGDLQMFVGKYPGMYIPVCDKYGYIQGLQMRLDVPEGGSEKKFRWFSSRHFNGGCGVKPWIHVVGDVGADEVCLTEGVMKADIASVLSGGRLFAAVPGVNAIGELPETIRSLGVKTVYEAFDMDKQSNPEVKRALISLRETLKECGVQCIGCSWDPRFKGIDDYYLAKKICAEQMCAA